MRAIAIFGAVGGLILSFLFTSCGGGDKDGDNRTVFRYNEAAGISSLDPAFARNLENIWAVNQLFNGLVTMNEDMEVVPCIAKDWEISEDGTVYTFHLRDDVYFHDDEVFPGNEGRKVVAEDFVHSFFRIIDEETASPGEYIFDKVKRSEETQNMGFTERLDLQDLPERTLSPVPGIAHHEILFRGAPRSGGTIREGFQGESRRYGPLSVQKMEGRGEIGPDPERSLLRKG